MLTLMGGRPGRFGFAAAQSVLDPFMCMEGLLTLIVSHLVKYGR